MMRWIFLTLLFFTNHLAFSAEWQHDLQEWQAEALLHLGCGNTHLLAKEPLSALREFQAASSLLDRSDDASCFIEFFILFSQVIAYDCLGLHKECRQTIDSLILMNEQDEEDDDAFGDATTMNKDSENAICLLYNLAVLTPSPSVREFLLFLIDSIAKEALPIMGCYGSHYHGSNHLDLGWNQNHISIDLCKHSVWKKLKKWTKEAVAWLNDVLQAFDTAKRIKEAYEQWKRKNDDHSTSFEEFKTWWYEHHRTF